MPVGWLVIEENNDVRRIALENRPVTLGRATTNDIVIDEPYVSRQHAKLIWRDGVPVLEDQGSTNGLLLNGQAVGEAPLTAGVIVEIWDPSRQQVVRLRFAPDGTPGAPAVDSPPTVHPMSGVLSGTLQLGSASWSIAIGRVTGNDVVLAHPQVSRHHATIEFRPTGAMLRDHSTNGTFLDGQRVTSPRPLKPGDRIRIASFEFEFDGERLVTYDQTSHARIDALNLTRVVGHNVTILHDVTLSVLPKEMIAIVGTSGAGKSTLMDALNGFRPATTGTVLLNGRNYYHEFASMRLMVGYVPQSDVVHRDLPASHALNYAAALRMPPDTSVQEREERVSEVLDEVGLTERKNVMVNQLSGGQIKRVSIGVELLTRPSLFFLDEPTSGLDPGYERRVMELLRQMADEGRTVSLVTHATQSIELCDHVAVMARGGYLAYFGPPKLALTHFDCTEYAGMYRRLEDAKSGEDLAEKFKASEGYDRYVRARSPEPGSVPELSDRHSPVTATLEAAPHPPNNVMRQTGILIQRYAETLTRDTRNLTLLLLQAPILAVLAGLIAKRHGLTTLPDLFQARDLMVILSCSMIWLGAMNSAREIVKELPVYRRERMVGLGLLPYLTSKYIVLGALCTMQAFILLGGLALRTDLPSRGVLLPGGIELFVTLLLTAAAGLAMGLMISTLFQNADRASALIPYVLIPQIIFVVSELTGAASYIAALTISHWSFEALGTTINLAASPDALFGLSASEFTHSAPFLLSRWGIILFVGAVFATASAVFLKRHDGQLM